MTLRLAAVAIATLFLQGGAPIPEILGTWRGTSTCVDLVRAPACKNEQVIYDVDTAGVPRGQARIKADKIVNGAREYMGEFMLSYDPGTRSWSADFDNTRFHGRWRFSVKDSSMTGDLVELPGGAKLRDIAAHRSR